MNKEIKVTVSPEYKKMIDKLTADMKAYGRNQVWEECTCKNCRWLKQDVTGSTVVCGNEKVIEFCGAFYPNQSFGCNKWEEDAS